jgi:aarF domain-containing kinase
MASAPPKSVWSRSTKLLGLAAGLARKELGGRLERAAGRSEELQHALQKVRVQVEQAKEIVESLGQLKGAAMKAGQLLSMELRDVLPPEVIEVLGKLQDSGATVPWEDIESILRDELGDKLAGLEVAHAPLASASIGQVHRATRKLPDGTTQQLVLKVQFRGISETIDSDLALLERIARAFLAVQAKHIDLSAVFTELKGVLARETDYRLEAESLLQYRALAHQVPGLRVPEVYPELSTQHVLALSFEPGLKLEAFLAQGPSQAERERVAHQLLDLYFREFFVWGLVQTDANFANFLFRPESGELVLLDFGATRSYDEAFRAAYRRLLITCFRGDLAGMITRAEGLKLISPEEGPESQQGLNALILSVLRVFRDEVQPFDFLDRDFVATSAKCLKAYYSGLQHSPPPAQLIFLHRKLGGIYTMGKALRVRLDLRPYWKRLETLEAESPPEAGAP